MTVVDSPTARALLALEWPRGARVAHLPLALRKVATAASARDLETLLASPILLVTRAWHAGGIEAQYAHGGLIVATQEAGAGDHALLDLLAEPDRVAIWFRLHPAISAGDWIRAVLEDLVSRLSSTRWHLSGNDEVSIWDPRCRSTSDDYLGVIGAMSLHSPSATACLGDHRSPRLCLLPAARSPS